MMKLTTHECRCRLLADLPDLMDFVSNGEIIVCANCGGETEKGQYWSLRIVKEWIGKEVWFLDVRIDNCWRNIVNGSYDYCLRKQILLQQCEMPIKKRRAGNE